MQSDTCHNTVFLTTTVIWKIVGRSQSHAPLESVQWLTQVLHGPVVIGVKSIDCLVGQVTNRVFNRRALPFWTEFLKIGRDQKIVVDVSGVVNVIVVCMFRR
jgi:hypothetical protein